VVILASDEYFMCHGGTNEGFLKGVYQNELSRSSVDAGGLAFWEKDLAAGVPRILLASAIRQTPEAAENRARHYYRTYLGRSPDLPGLTSDTASALYMTFLQGRWATFGQALPTMDRSTIAIFWPCPARVQVRILPATPLPIMRF
jgi:hypothetical protein